jgi:hypothetical protein
MTEFVRPGPLGTTEHDSSGEFSKIRLNRPSHSFIGKGQAPVLLGAASYDDEVKRMLQRNAAPGSRSIEADVKAIVASYEQSVANMVETKRRLPGSGSLTGWANNVKRELQFQFPAKESQSKGNPPMFDCADQATEVLNNLHRLGLAKRWKLHLIGSPPHYKAQAVPIDSVSPLITMDPWVNRYEIRYPPYKVSTEINAWAPY